jgi:hypothetical protein
VNTQGLDENLVARVVGAVLRELGYGDPLPRPEPELLPDAEIRRMFFNCSRSKYWSLTKTAGFPVGIAIGKSTHRRVAEVRSWLADQEL